jgi:hypothetical protein
MRTLKRPMFRIGGSAGEGITSGLVPRQGYEAGNTVEYYKQILGEAAGQRPDRSLSDFLIDFGLDYASAPPSGGPFATAAQSAKKPFQRYQAAKADRAAFDQKLGLSAATMALEHEQAQKLKMMGDKAKISKIQQLANDLQRNNPNLYPNTKKGNSDAFNEALRLTETSPGKSKQDRWDNVYNKQDPNIVPSNVAENRADFVVYVRPNIPPNVYGGSVPTITEGKGQQAVDVVDPTKMEPGKVYWDEQSGTLFEVVENENGERIPQEVVGWRDKYYKR